MLYSQNVGRLCILLDSPRVNRVCQHYVERMLIPKAGKPIASATMGHAL